MKECGWQKITKEKETAGIVEKLPQKKQQEVPELSCMVNFGTEESQMHSLVCTAGKRTGKEKFNLPVDFDEHFDDLNDEISAMFTETFS